MKFFNKRFKKTNVFKGWDTYVNIKLTKTRRLGRWLQLESKYLYLLFEIYISKLFELGYVEILLIPEV